MWKCQRKFKRGTACGCHTQVSKISPSKLTIKTPKRDNWHCSGAFTDTFSTPYSAFNIVNFEQVNQDGENRAGW